MARKRREYLMAGVRLVWEVAPRSRTVTVYDAPERSTIIDASLVLEGDEVLPGFALVLADLFDDWNRHEA